MQNRATAGLGVWQAGQWVAVPIGSIDVTQADDMMGKLAAHDRR